ncbi:hypothetical protein ACEN3H_12710 [Acinetobacter lactucae]|uniref:hypothetical protein n=1 Tax=Acinetobacter lactucae TaxID=1785128 RepID=UPI00358DD73F
MNKNFIILTIILLLGYSYQEKFHHLQKTSRANKFNKLLVQLDNPNVNMTVKKKILCEDYSKILEMRNTPGFIRILDNEMKYEEELLTKLTNKFDNYKKKLKVTCK